MEDSIRIAGLVMTLTGLVFGLFLAIRNRTLFKPDLRFSFRSSVWDDAVPKALRKAPLEALIIFNPTPKPLKHLLLPLRIENRTRRKINDILIELTYPASFAITNAEHKEQIDKARELFSKKLGDDRETIKQLERRESFQWGELFRVRYDIGMLRPGDSLSFNEYLKLPERDAAFRDPRFSDKLFDRILEILQGNTTFLALCHVQASVMCDVNLPLRSQINLVSVITNEKDPEEAAVAPYSHAHWLNDYPAGRSYFRPHLLFFERFLPPLMRTAAVDLVEPKVVHHVARLENQVAVGTAIDDFGSTHGMAELRLPGYDPYTLPRQTENVDAALRSIGYRSGRPMHPLKNLFRQRRPSKRS